MAVIEPLSKKLTKDEILALLDRPEDTEVTNTERIATYLEEADEAFIEDSSTDPLSQPEQQLPCELNLGPKSNESDDSGRGSGDMPISDLRSRDHSGEMKDKGVIGLVNIGNSCYMNAGLQCLLNTPALVEYFGSRHYGTLGEPDSPKAKLLRVFGMIFNKVWGRVKPTDDGTLKLNYFKGCLSEVHSVFKGSAQQDCQEFITLLLDTLDEQLKANILRGRRELAEGRNDLPGSSDSKLTHLFGSSASKGTDLAGSLPSSRAAGKSPLKSSSMPNRRALPKVTNAIKSVSLLPEFSIFTTVPKFVDSKKSNTEDDANDISSDCQVVEAGGSSKFRAKKPKSARDFPPPKRVRLDSENEPSRSRRTADYFGIQELKISDDEEEDSQRVPEMSGNPKPVSELTANQKVMSELDAELQLISEMCAETRGRLGKVATIFTQVPLRPDNGQRVQNTETETCSIITKAFEGALTRTITCAECNHSSSEREPFQNLTLPIPRDAHRIIEIVFVSIYDMNRSWNRRGRKYDLSLRLSQTVKDIKEVIVSVFNNPDYGGQLKRVEDMVMTYMWDHEVKEILPDDFQVRSLNETKSFYLFEVNHDFPSGNNDIPNGHNVNPHGHNVHPNGHNDLSNGPHDSPSAEQDFSVDSDASTFVLDEDVTVLVSESLTMNSKSSTEFLDCAKCWKSTRRDNVRVNVECECVLCLECIEELTKKSIGTYKCPQCTQKVALTSLCPIDNALTLFSIVFMNETRGQRYLFGCPMLLRLPSKVLAQELREYFHQTGLGLGLRSDKYDILLLSHSPRGCMTCVTCGPDSYCPGCPLPRSGMVLIPEGTTIVVRFFNLLDQDLECMRPEYMAVGTDVDFDPEYIFEASFHINDCLDLFTGKEKLEHEQFCVKCGKNREVIKSLAISHCPDYVILNVERHGFGMNQKLENPIEFNLKLDLSKYVSPECAQSAKYDLYGVVCHSGGASYGHYTAFVKNPWTLKWYFCDDSNVVQQDPDQSIYSSAFILFWHREGIELKPDLEFARCRPKSPPPPLRTSSPAQSHSNSKSRPLGLSRRRQSVLPQASSSSSSSSASSHKPGPRKTLFEKKNESTYSPTLRNEILTDFCIEETEESRTVDEGDEDCVNFIGRDDHLPYYSGMPTLLNGQINPNVTYTLDSDPLQVDPWG